LYRLFGLAVLQLAPVDHRPLLAAYFTADLVISSAGNFLYTSGRLGLTFVISVYTMLYAWLVGKPFYTMPQTIGPLAHRWERWLVKCVANRARLVFVRDTISLAELESLGIAHNRFWAVPDLAFAYPSCPPEMGTRLLQTYGLDTSSSRPRLGVTMMNWAAQNPAFTNQSGYETAVAHTIRTFIDENNGQAVLFSQVCGPTFIEDDRVPARRVKEQLVDCGPDVILIEQEPTTEELKAAYNLMDVFIGTRLHANIFAISEGIPALMIEYRYKTRGVMQMLDLDTWVMDIQMVNETNLNTKFKQLWTQRAEVQAHIQERLPAIIAAASEAGQLIATDFAGRMSS
jgi:colanic acid/amylovoran biosynthesis protein